MRKYSKNKLVRKLTKDITGVFYKVDPEGLRLSRFPSDEYHPKAVRVAKKLVKYRNEFREAMARDIANIFTDRC